MKQLFLCIALFLLCSCNTHKKLSQQQKETFKQFHLETDSLQVRNIYQQLQEGSFNIRHIQLTPPDSSQKQSIHSITLIEATNKEIKELVSEQTENHSLAKYTKRETKLSENRSWKTKTRFRFLLWLAGLFLAIVFIRYRYRG